MAFETIRRAAVGFSIGLLLSGSAFAHEGEEEKVLGVTTPAYSGGPLTGASFAKSNIELMAHMPFSTIGGVASDVLGNDVWGWIDSTTGKEYALVGRRDGTAFVDVSNPASPTYLGLLPSHTSFKSDWRDIEVYQDHAFVVADNAGFHGMQVFDLTQLRGVTTPTTFTETASYNDQLQRRGHTISINTDSGYAYINGSNTFSGGLHMVDIRNPAAPVFAGSYAADGYVHDAQVVNYHGPDVDYVGREVAFASNSATVNGPYSLTIVDVTNKSAPAQVSKSSYPQAGYAHQGWLTPDQRFFIMDDELDEVNVQTQNGGVAPPTRTHIWNVENLDAPVYVGFHEGTMHTIDHNLYIKGNLVFQGNYESGLRVLELTDVANGRMTEVAHFDTYPLGDGISFNGVWSPYPFLESGTILVNDRQYGLFVLRFKPDTFMLGDMDGDGDLDNFDIQPFELALTESDEYRAQFPLLTDYSERGDIDGNNVFDNFDIQAFEALLTADEPGASMAVPEPSGLVLGAIGTVLASLFSARYQRRRIIRDDLVGR